MTTRTVSPARPERRQLAYANLPAAEPDAQRAWLGYPPDDAAYEAFVHEALDWATGTLRAARAKGLDPHGGDLQVFGAPVSVHNDDPALTITNGVIDFGSREEGSDVHAGANGPREGGWTDPELERVGSASREVLPIKVLQKEPCHVSLRRRELSFISLDLPTWAPGHAGGSFWRHVIDPLVSLPPEDDHLYGWLAVMFEFCAGKPLVYFSRYVPSLAVHQLAWHFQVRVIPRPLQAIPTRLRQQHRTFRMLHLTEPQWDALNRNLAGQGREEGPARPPKTSDPRKRNRPVRSGGRARVRRRQP